MRSAICETSEGYMNNADELDPRFNNHKQMDFANDYLNCDHFSDAFCDIENSNGDCGLSCYHDDKIIDRNANAVNANYLSCYVDETIIPAIKEETQVEQRACYDSNTESDYKIHGDAANEYVLKGGLTQWSMASSTGTSDTAYNLDINGSSGKDF